MPEFHVYDKRFNPIVSKTTFSLGETMGDLCYVGGGFFLVASTTELVLWKLALHNSASYILKVKTIFTAGVTEPLRGVTTDGKNIIIIARDTVAVANRFRIYDFNGNQITTFGIGATDMNGACWTGHLVCSIRKGATDSVRRFYIKPGGVGQQIDFIGNLGTATQAIEFDGHSFWIAGNNRTIAQLDMATNIVKQSGTISKNFAGIMTDGHYLFLSVA